MRRARRGNLIGILITIALHGGVLAAVHAANSKESEPLEIPRDFVVAKLVKLGKPREKFWLPRITQPPRPTAPPAAIKVAEDPNAKAAPKEAPRPENPDISKNLRRALDRARKLEQMMPEEPEEGQLNGSAEGTATEASAGDAYATAIAVAIRKNWSLPVGLVSDGEMNRLIARVRVSVSGSGELTDAQIVKTSGNNYFDDSCITAVKTTGKVPPPPASVARQFARGVAIDFSPKDL